MNSPVTLTQKPRASYQDRTPVPLVDFRIVDARDAGRRHDGRTAGEIVVRAPWLPMGYLNQSGVFGKSSGGATFTPATSATMTADGVVQITDRIKDVIRPEANGFRRSSWRTYCSMPSLSEAASSAWRMPNGASARSPSLSPIPVATWTMAAVRKHVKAYADKGP